MKEQNDSFEPVMIRIPAGKFLMGTNKEQAQQVIANGVDEWKRWVEREQPQHTVELSEYSIGKYPITNREYQVFIKDTKYNPPSDWDGDQFPEGKGEHPVGGVSWGGAIAYCKWLSVKSGKAYRLPTEAEWEKAARGEDGRIYPWGNQFNLNHANTLETKLRDTSKVGQFSPLGDSPYGCADMAGNVWEWCNDWFDEDEYKNCAGKATKDPQGPQSGGYRIIRGGCAQDGPTGVRCANRIGYSPDSFISFLMGFRVVSSL